MCELLTNYKDGEQTNDIPSYEYLKSKGPHYMQTLSKDEWKTLNSQQKKTIELRSMEGKAAAFLSNVCSHNSQALKPVFDNRFPARLIRRSRQSITDNKLIKEVEL